MVTSPPPPPPTMIPTVVSHINGSTSQLLVSSEKLLIILYDHTGLLDFARMYELECVFIVASKAFRASFSPQTYHMTPWTSSNTYFGPILSDISVILSDLAYVTDDTVTYFVTLNDK
jgi:hypothetical protein